MPIIYVFSRHLPENCPMFNEKARKAMVDYMNAGERIGKKHGIKVIFSGGVHTEHLSLEVFDAPSVDAFRKSLSEPEIIALSQFETYEVKLGESAEEAMKMLKGK